MKISEVVQMSRRVITDQSISNPRTDAAALFDGNTIVFRETEDFKNWMEDFEVYLTEWAHIKAHYGFVSTYLSIQQSVKSYCQGLKGTITICGHSLGAALALLCAWDLYLDGHSVEVYTTGCPRVFSWSSARTVNNHLPKVVRYVNDQDWVTHSPPAIAGYKHVGRKFQVGKWWRFWTNLNPTNDLNAHAKDQYLAHSK